jgi:heat shock protein 5
MDENPEADMEDYKAKLKEVEQIANPIMRNLYSAGAGGEGGGAEDDAGDFGDDEL